MNKLPVRNKNLFFRTDKETPELQKKRMLAISEAYKMYTDDIEKDPTSWWNKAKIIHHKESKDMLDYYLTIKYFHEDTNLMRRDNNPDYQEHFSLKKLITDNDREEEALRQAKKTKHYISPNEMSPDLNLRQPRNTGLSNYNFEEHKDFSRLYNNMMEQDRQKQYEVKRIWKYIKQNPNQSESIQWKRKLLFGKPSQYMDIDKFVDNSVDVEGYEPPKKMRARRTFIRTRSSTDISDYDSWIVSDRALHTVASDRAPRAKIVLTPAHLIHVFGDPLWGFNSTTTGLFMFEDTNLDMFSVSDPNTCEETKGINKADEYYLRQVTSNLIL